MAELEKEVSQAKEQFKKLYQSEQIKNETLSPDLQIVVKRLDMQYELLQKQVNLLENLVKSSKTKLTGIESSLRSSDDVLKRLVNLFTQSNEYLNTSTNELQKLREVNTDNSELLLQLNDVMKNSLVGMDKVFVDWVASTKELNKEQVDVIKSALLEQSKYSESLLSKMFEQNKEVFEKFVLDYIRVQTKEGKDVQDSMFKLYEQLLKERNVDRKELEKTLVAMFDKYKFSEKKKEQFKIKVREERQESGEYGSLKEVLSDLVNQKKTELKEEVQQNRGSLLGAIAGAVDPRLGMAVEVLSDITGNIPKWGKSAEGRGGGLGRGVGGGGVFTTGTITGKGLGFLGKGGEVGVNVAKGGAGVAQVVGGGIGKLVKGAPLLGAVLGVGTSLLTGGGVAEAVGGGIGGVVGSVLGTALGPIGTVVGGVVGGFVGEWLGKNFDTIKKKAGKVFTGIWEGIKDFGKNVISVFKKFEEFKIEVFKKFTDWIKSGLEWLWDILPDFVKSLLKKGKEKAQEVYEVGKEKAKEVYETGKEITTKTYEAGKETATKAWESGKQVAKKAYETGKEVLQYVGESLGIVARKAEAASPDIYKGAGVISTGKGDAGGVSYGTYQLSSKRGTLQEFLKKSGYAKEFEGLEVNSPEFKQKWKELSKTKEFAEAQHKFIADTHYAPAVKALESYGIDVSKSRALQEMAFSRGVQQRGYFKNVLQNVFKGMTKEEISKLSDEQIVRMVYKELETNVDKYFKSSDEKTRKGLRKRFSKEADEILAVKKKEEAQIMAKKATEEEKKETVKGEAEKEPVLKEKEYEYRLMRGEKGIGAEKEYEYRPMRGEKGIGFDSTYVSGSKIDEDIRKLSGGEVGVSGRKVVNYATPESSVGGGRVEAGVSAGQVSGISGGGGMVGGGGKKEGISSVEDLELRLLSSLLLE